MSNRVERDYLRLTHNEPLVLAVSALSDFLWEDFVRDTQPTVKYLIEQYNIRQLSRFGKEVFDFLYNGGAVTPLISLEDVEHTSGRNKTDRNLTSPLATNLKLHSGWLCLRRSVTLLHGHGWYLSPAEINSTQVTTPSTYLTN